MISARLQRNSSAKKVWMETCSRVLCAAYVAFLSMCLLFTAKGQGPPPQPPTSGPGEADSPSAPIRHQIGPVYPTINSVCHRMEHQMRLLDI